MTRDDRSPQWELSGFVEQPSLGPAERRGVTRIGAYELRGEIARGGMGVVYRGFHPVLGRAVAIKVLHAGERAGPRQLARFQTEARSAAKLRHPGIVAIHDVGSDQGCPFIVMDLIEGDSLAGLIEQEGTLPQRRAAELTRHIAEALEYAHSRGILHRDVKPQNVLLGEDGQPYLTDFGLAKDTKEQSGMTVTGQFLGTPGYSPPEQVRGAVDAMGPCSDVYALGATLYAMLTGGPPGHDESAVKTLVAAMSGEVNPPSMLRDDLDRDLETICLKCLEVEPAARYPSAADVAADIQRYLRDEPITARRPSRLDRVLRWTRRNKGAVRLGTAGAVLALGGAIAGVAWFKASSASEALQQAEAAAQRSGLEHSSQSSAALSGVRKMLEQAGSQRMTPEERGRVVASIALLRGPATLALLVGELDRVVQDMLRPAEREVYLRAEQPTPDEARAGEKPLSELRQALARRAGKRPGAELPAATRKVLLQAEERLRRRALRRRTMGHQLPSAGVVGREVASLQGKRLGLLGAQRAEVLCRALGALRIPRGGVEALGRYLEAERDERRAAAAASALCRLGGGAAQRLVFLALDRFGTVFSRGLVTDLPRLIETPIEEGSALHLAGRARIRLAQGELARAKADLTRAVALEPKNAAHYGSRALVFHKLRDFQAEAEDLGRALRLAPRDVGLWVRRAEAFRRVKLPARVEKDLKRALELDPYYAPAWIGKGMLYGATKRHTKAIEAYSRAIQLDPRQAEAFYQRARAYKGVRDHPRALADYDRAIQIEPKHAKAWRNRGSVKAKMGDLAGALEDVTKAMELDPQNPWAPTYRGNVRARQGDLAGAMADYDLALKLDPRLARTWADRSAVRLLLGQPKGALADAVEAVRLDPAEALGWNRRADAKRALGDLQGAEEDYGHTLELDATFGTAWCNRALVRLARGNRKGALADCDQAIKLDAEFLQAWINRGLIKRRLGDLAGALSDLNRALEIRPTSAAALVNRSRVWLAKKQTKKALIDLDRAIEVDPRFAAGWVHRAALRRSLGRAADAARDCTRAIELEPKNFSAWAIRGLARASQGNRRAAASDLRRYLELAPKNDPQRKLVQAKLKDLQ